MVTSTYQVMPPLTDDERQALQADIAENGIRVAVVKDRHGNILDGHHRTEIAEELGIDYPVVVHEVANEAEARQVALTLNLARRHLSQEQKRALIEVEIEADPEASDRAIARRLQCSPTTVGNIRRRLSNVDTDYQFTEEERAEAERLTERGREGIEPLAHEELAVLGNLVAGDAVAVDGGGV